MAFGRCSERCQCVAKQMVFLSQHVLDIIQSNRIIYPSRAKKTKCLKPTHPTPRSKFPAFKRGAVGEHGVSSSCDLPCHKDTNITNTTNQSILTQEQDIPLFNRKCSFRVHFPGNAILCIILVKQATSCSAIKDPAPHPATILSPHPPTYQNHPVKQGHEVDK